MAEQQQFDWQKETAKCVEGLKFDLEQDYTFELQFDGVSLHTMTRKDGTEVVFKKGERAGMPVKMYTFPFLEKESEIVFKLDFFHGDRYKVNPANPELEDEIVLFSRKLGYNPVVDGNFSIGDFINPGITFTAKLKELPAKEGAKAYKTIDIATIEVVGSGPSGSQSKVSEPSDAEQREILALAKGCKKFSELVSRINKTAKKDEYLDAAMRMKETGKLKF